MKKTIIIIGLLFAIFTPRIVNAQCRIVSENDKRYCYDENGIKQSGFQPVEGIMYFFSRIGDNTMRTGTFSIDGSYYHFNDDGKMQRGLLTEDNEIHYYSEEDGKRAVGFTQIGDDMYFFSRVGNNAMRTGTFPIDGSYYHFNKDGKMQRGLLTEDNEIHYYSEEDGKRAVGFTQIGNDTYFFSRVGNNAMRTGTFSIDGSYYHFNKDGKMHTGWLKENGKQYYFDSISGKMQTGKITIDSETFFFSETGEKVSGFQNYLGDTYFFSRIGNNIMRTGFFAIDGYYYYFDTNGKMLKGFQTPPDGIKRFFSRTDGKMRTGLVNVDGSSYYFDTETGSIITGYKTIDDKEYYFDTNGIMFTGILYDKLMKESYFYNNDGVKSYGFQDYDGNTYFFSRINNHAMRTGFFAIDGYYYYFDVDGKMLKGFQTPPDGIERFFSRIDGKMRTKWTCIDGYMYYFNPDTGERTIGTTVIDRINYEFDEDGRLKPGFTSDLDGNSRYYYPDGNYAKGWVTIGGIKYFFNEYGIMIAKNAKKVIDVSYHNGTIDWWKIRNQAEVDAAIIRVAYRGYGTGALVNDTEYINNINGAIANGIPFGIYVYSQAINTSEAIEEADRAISIANQYKGKITLPIVIDTEYTDAWENGKRIGRADYLTRFTRTDIVKAFVERVTASGYEPMIYASKSFLMNNLNMNELSNYKLWVAQYYDYCTYPDTSNIYMWQYTSDGVIAGSSARTDISVMY